MRMGSLRLMVGSFAAGGFLPVQAGRDVCRFIYLFIYLYVIVLADGNLFVRVDARFPAAILRAS